MKAAADLTVAEVATAIGVPVQQWSGKCYAIACAILRAKLVKGRPAYGHWTGPVHSASPFASKGSLSFVRHGWIVLPNGAVLDPTRWVFEAVEPYLYHGLQPDDADCVDCGYKEYEHGDEDDDAVCGGYTAPVWPYDEGGDRLRAATQRPMPMLMTGDRLLRLRLPKKLRERLGLPQEMSHSQLAWLANLPYATMGKDAWLICLELDAAGCKAYVPLDTWTRADAERGL